MKASNLCINAKSLLSKTTCYLKGFWGQSLTQAEYDRVLKMYPDNAKYGNSKYIGTDAWAFDCICLVKFLLAIGDGQIKRISYSQMASNPVGDCTTQSFKKKLYDTCSPKDAKAGYGLATDGHAALALGNGMWIDCNYSGGQNGLVLHTTGIERFDVAGKIPGVEYTKEYPEVKDFLDYLYKIYCNSK